MKDIHKIYLWIAFSCLFSIIALCFSLCKVTPFTISEATYIGIIVSLMGIIFTIFVGYQIYNIIDIKKELKDFSAQKQELEQAVLQLSEAQVVSAAYNFSNRGMLAVSMHNYEKAVGLMLKALETFLTSTPSGNHWADIENLKTNITYCTSRAGTWEGTEKEDIHKSITAIMNSPQYSILPGDLKKVLVDLKNSIS